MAIRNPRQRSEATPEIDEETDEEKLMRHYRFYLSSFGDVYWDRPADGQTCDLHQAAQLLSLVTDLPARWIFDIASGRKE
jgi:hypothetical protein